MSTTTRPLAFGLVLAAVVAFHGPALATLQVEVVSKAGGTIRVALPGTEVRVPDAPVPFVIPNSPSNLVAAASSSTTIELQWFDNSSNESEFRIEFKTSGQSYQDIGASIPADTTAVQITGASPSTTFTFRVRAHNSSGYSGYTNEASATTPASGGGSLPAAPSSLVATAVSSMEIDLHWNDNSNNESEFRVEYHTPGQSFSDLGSAIPANATTIGVTGATASTTYTFRVKARNGAGDSTYSNEASATTPAAGTNCTVDSTTLCLYNGRFKVQAAYRDYANNRGTGKAVALTSDTGYFWFFSASNVESVVKIVSFCGGGSNNYAVYAGGLTDVEVTLTVTDTQNGTSRTYTNPLGTPFTLIRDGPFSCP